MVTSTTTTAITTFTTLTSNIPNTTDETDSGQSSTTVRAMTSSLTTNSTVITQLCQSGYESVNGACVDIDECESTDTHICESTTSCRNMNGSYICICERGLLKRKLIIYSLDGTPPKDVWSCVYIITVNQHFGLEYTPSLSNVSSPEYKFFSEILQQKISYMIYHLYIGDNWRSVISGVRIFAFSDNPFLAHYEVMTNWKIDISGLVYAHNYSVQYKFWSGRYGLPGIAVGIPKSGDLICLNDIFLSRQVMHRNYSFLSTNVNTTQTSEESCGSSGYSATIECVARTYCDGSVSAFYDVTTLQEVQCSMNTSDLLNHLSPTNLTSQTLESTLGMISALSSLPSTQSIKDIIAILDILQAATDSQDIEVTENTMTFLLWTVDNLHHAVYQADIGGETVLSAEDRIMFVKSLGIFASHLTIENDNFSLFSPSNIFQAQKINCSLGPSEFRFNETMTQDIGVFQPHVYSEIPKSAIPTSCTGSITAVYFLHKDKTMFPTSTKKMNQVFSSQLSRTKLSNLAEPIIISFSQPARDAATENDYIVHRCAYLDLETGEWKHDGCTTVVMNTGTTQCDCDHATNFAVLVQTRPVSGSYALSIIGSIGCSLSTVGLILVMIIYLSFKKLRTNQINQLHIHLSGCLTIAYITFLIGVERPRAYVPCMVVGFILQFAFLSAWGFMFAECVTMYKKFVKVFSFMSSAYVIKTACIVYGVSLLVTLITIIVAGVIDMEEYSGWESAADNVDALFHPSYYVSDRLCWLHGYSLYFGFLTPVAIMFVGNIFGYSQIIRILTNPNMELRSNKVSKNDLKNHAFRIMTVSVLLGVTWAFAIPLTITDDVIVNEVFSWLFSISNAFQGVFIFLLFCVKRQDVRVMWMKYIPILRKTKIRSVSTTSVTLGSEMIGNSTTQISDFATDNKGFESKEQVELETIKESESVDSKTTPQTTNNFQENTNENNSVAYSNRMSTALTQL